MENITTERFKELQLEGKKMMVDFFADWCGPCKQLIPRLEQMEKEYPNVSFVKINVDENMDTALDLGIRSVPTVMLFKGEELVNRSQGAQPDRFYKDILNGDSIKMNGGNLGIYAKKQNTNKWILFTPECPENSCNCFSW